MKHNIKMWLYMMVLCGGILFPVKSSAKEEPAQVMNYFMEVKEKVTAKEEPTEEAADGKILEKGQWVLILTRTETGWYQIVCQGEILYIPVDQVKEQEIAEEAVTELEKAEEGYLTIDHDEMRSLVEKGIVTEGAEYEQIVKEIAAEKGEKRSIWFSRGVFFILVLVVLISGGGYWYLQKKEEREKEKNRRNIEILEWEDGEDDEQ